MQPIMAKMEMWCGTPASAQVMPLLQQHSGDAQ